MSAERDERGCFPGCYTSGCEATNCNLFKGVWREEQWRLKRDAEAAAREAKRPKSGWTPDGRYLTEFDVQLLETMQSLAKDVRELVGVLKRRR